MRCRIGFAGVAASAALALAGLGAGTVAVHAGNSGIASLHVSDVMSTGQAGYELSPAPASASVAGTFTVPALTCTPSLAGIAPGSFIFTSSSVTGSTLFVVCQGGTPLYQAELIINGNAFAVPMAVNAGDIIRTGAAESATRTRVTFTDVTQHFAAGGAGPGGAVSAVLEGIDTLTTGQGPLPVPAFTTMPFRLGSIDGQTLAASGATALTLAIHPPTVNIKTSKLSTNGKRFVEYFRHS